MKPKDKSDSKSKEEGDDSMDQDESGTIMTSTTITEPTGETLSTSTHPTGTPTRGRMYISSTKSATTKFTSPFTDSTVSISTNPSSTGTRTSKSYHNGMIFSTTAYNGRSLDHENNMAALAVALPSAIFALLLFVGFILVWKKYLKRKSLRRDSVKSHRDGIIQDVGDKLKDPGLSVEPPVTSLNQYTDPDMKGKGSLANNTNSVEEAQYAEVDERSQSEDSSLQPMHYKVDPEGSHGYEEAKVRGSQNNEGYEEAKLDQKFEEAKDSKIPEGQKYETAKVTGPFYHTLDPNTSSDSSSVPVRKQDGGYDILNRQHIPKQAESKADSDYDSIQRIGKGDDKVEHRNEMDSDYSALSRSSANTSDYDRLDQTKRSFEVDSISPNDYNVLQLQEE